MIKAAIIDFDGTLVADDMLSVVCGIVGKEDASRQLARAFIEGRRPGLSPLIERINFLKGVTISQLEEKINEDPHLMPGARELFSYFNEHHIVSIVSSGNILPVLTCYQKMLGITYAVGSKPQMQGDTIFGISENNFSHRDFKITESKEILNKLSISQKETLAIGDSPADKMIFDYAEVTIAIHPIHGIEKAADYVITDDLQKVIPIIERYL